MGEIGSFYRSKYTGEDLDEILKNVYDSVPVDGGKPMTGPLTLQKVENGYGRLEKDHTATTDLGTALRDVDKSGNVVTLLLKAADNAARLQLGTTLYDLIHTGNIQPYIKPYADAAEAASEEAAAALAGVREAINNIPEGVATPIVNDLTTGGVSMALSAEQGKKLKQELDTRVNPNLLDNGYFGNLVNQRGQTEYTNGYTIDRWFISQNSGTLTIGDGGITLSGVGEVGRLRQSVDNVESYYGKVITLSALMDNNTLLTCTGVLPSSATSSTQNFGAAGNADSSGIGMYMNTSGKVYVQLYVPNGVSRTFSAAKLELGTHQTLAHQDADGNWVLNEIPNYAEELAKCQRYFQNLTAIEGVLEIGYGYFYSATQAYVVLPVPVTMRAKPAINYTGNGVMDLTSYGSKTITACMVYGYTNNEIVVGITGTGFIKGNVAAIRVTNSGISLTLDANL